MPHFWLSYRDAALPSLVRVRISSRSMPRLRAGLFLCREHMATKSTHGTEGPMTLGNMRANGVNSLTVQCHKCWHEVVVDASPWPDDLPVPALGPRLVCSKCGTIGADVRPNWLERER
jgi:hypothetical protein